MLGVNLIFAGFALSLNGLSYLKKVDDNAKAIANILVGIVIAINAIFQIAAADSYVTFGFGAAMWLFSLNYFVIASHILLKASNWNVFGIYGLFAAIVSIIFGVDTIVNGGPWEMIYMWFMWAVLWAQSFFAITLESKFAGKFNASILILNGILSTFVPGILILLGVIL